MIARPTLARPTPARDVKPGESWAFRDHRSIAQIDRDAALDDANMQAALEAHRARLARTADKAGAA